MKSLLASLGVIGIAFSVNAGARQLPRGRQQNVRTLAEQFEADQQAKEPEPEKKAPVDPNKFAIIIAGVGGEESYTKRFSLEALRLYRLLTSKYGFAERNAMVLIENGAQGIMGAEDGFVDPDKTAIPPVMSRSTAQGVRDAFAKVKAQANADSLVFVILIGHGSAENNEPKFNLVGPDLAAKDYGKLLDQLPARRIIFINCSSASAGFVKALSKQGRIIVTATRGDNEQNVTVFPEQFIEALSNKDADANKDGRISILEAFNYATHNIAESYQQQGLLATEHALIDDNGDGTGHESATDGDGALAANTYLDSAGILELAGDDAELAPLMKKRQELNDAISQLKGRKQSMKIEDYENELEKLLVDLALTDQKIRAHKK